MSEDLLIVFSAKGAARVHDLFKLFHGLELGNVYMCTVCTSLLLLIILCFINFIKYRKHPMSKVTPQLINPEQLHILIVGGAKSGKTSTLGSLAGHNKIGQFSVCPNLKYVLNDDVYGWNIFAVKCENVSTTQSEDQDDIQVFSESLKNIVKFLDNFHMIVYCLPFQSSWTKELMKNFEVLKSVLGHSILKQHVIFGFTHGETFEGTKQKQGYDNFEDWLNGLEPCALKYALKECKNRCVLLHNKTENEEQKRKQALRMFSLCRDIVFNKACLRMREVEEDFHLKTKVETPLNQKKDLLDTESGRGR